MTPIKCYSLYIVQCLECGILGGPRSIDFDIGNGFHVTISQVVGREILIQSSSETDSEILYQQFSVLNKLLMVLQGNFIPIETIEFWDKDGNVCPCSDKIAEFIRDHTLSYYSSRDIFQGGASKLCEFDMALNERVFIKWRRLLKKLEIIHQIVLYNMADTGLPADIALAFCIQAMEPIYEYLVEIKEIEEIKKTKKISKNKQCCIVKNEEISLKERLDIIISKYGADIFSNECANDNDKNKFLTHLKNSRIRIMHIIRKDKDPYFEGIEALVYMSKMTLLYRHILLKLLEVDESVYDERLKIVAHNYEQIIRRTKSDLCT